MNTGVYFWEYGDTFDTVKHSVEAVLYVLKHGKDNGDVKSITVQRTVFSASNLCIITIILLVLNYSSTIV